MSRVRLQRGIPVKLSLVAAVSALSEPLTFIDDFEWVAFFVGAVGTLVLLVCGRLPLAALYATLPAALTGHLLLSVITICAVASARPQCRLRLPCGLLFAAALCPWPLSAAAELTATELLKNAELAGLMTIGPAVLGQLARARTDSHEQLTQRRASQAHEQMLSAERAVNRERAKLARNIHDTVAHHVSIIAVQAGALWAAQTDPVIRADAEKIRIHSVKALEDLRDIVGMLRSSEVLLTGTQSKCGPRLADLPELLADSGLEVPISLRALTEQSWPPFLEETVYRIVQEALTNVRKHATGAPVTLSAAVTEKCKGCTSLVLEVRNAPAAPRPDGVPAHTGGYGLTGLRERATRLGGQLIAAPSGDGGFLVRAVLPLRDSPAAGDLSSD